MELTEGGLALDDVLTGYPNLRGMEMALDALESPGHIAVLDLNALMAFNDVHGHTAGDAVIVTVANRLRAGVGDKGTVYWMGGGEFVVLLPEMNAKQSECLLSDLLSAVAEPIAVGAESFSISATAGLSATALHDPGRTLRLADAAQYRAKCQRVPYAISGPPGKAG